MPLAGCRDSVPAGVWGNAPTVPRATNSKEAANKGAGSEASLPVTLRSRRSAPKLLYPSLTHCRAKWARPDCWSFSIRRGFRACGRDQRAFRSPFGNLRCPLAKLVFIVAPISLCSLRPPSNNTDQVWSSGEAEGVKGAIGKPPVASAEAKPLPQTKSPFKREKSYYSPNLIMEERFSTIARAIHGLFIV